MKYETLKGFAEGVVVVHTRAYENAIYVGKVAKLTQEHITLDPAINQSWEGGSPTSKQLERISEGIPLRIDLEDIVAIGKFPPTD